MYHPSDRPGVCTPGTYADVTGLPTCALCQPGEYQPAYNSTGCLPCAVASYCPGYGTTSPTPCSGGTWSNVTGLYDALQCVDVESGFWAPTGSGAPKACPVSGFTCPGRAADEVNDPPGSEPILVESGQSSVDVEVEVVTFNMELAMTVDQYDETAMIAELAAYYGVDPSLISLEATPITDRRRLASNGSAAGGSSDATGRLLLTVTILVPDEIEETAADSLTTESGLTEAGSQSGGASGGPTVSRVAVTAKSFADRLALLNSGDGNLLMLSAALGFNTTVGGGGVEIGMSTQQVQVSCPMGYWCSAANRIECIADTYQPKENQVDAGACLPCAEFSESLPASTAKSACKCVYGYYDADVDPAALPVCKPCPVGSDCKGAGNTLMLLPLEEGYFRVTKYDVDIRRCPDFGVDVGSACVGGSGKARGYVYITMCMLACVLLSYTTLASSAWRFLRHPFTPIYD